MNVTKHCNRGCLNITDLCCKILIYAAMIVVISSCSSLDDRQESLRKFGNEKFDRDLWRVSGAYVRGTMIYDFVKGNTPIVGKSRAFILSNLGESTGYFEYDLNPTYYIGGIFNGRDAKAHVVAFIIDKKSKNVRDIQLYP